MIQMRNMVEKYNKRGIIALWVRIKETHGYEKSKTLLCIGDGVHSDGDELVRVAERTRQPADQV